MFPIDLGHALAHITYTVKALHLPRHKVGLGAINISSTSGLGRNFLLQVSCFTFLLIPGLSNGDKRGENDRCIWYFPLEALKLGREKNTAIVTNDGQPAF